MPARGCAPLRRRALDTALAHPTLAGRQRGRRVRRAWKCPGRRRVRATRRREWTRAARRSPPRSSHRRTSSTARHNRHTRITSSSRTTRRRSSRRHTRIRGIRNLTSRRISSNPPRATKARGRSLPWERRSRAAWASSGLPMMAATPRRTRTRCPARRPTRLRRRASGRVDARSARLVGREAWHSTVALLGRTPTFSSCREWAWPAL